MTRLLAWLVPSSALHWDRLRPLTAPDPETALWRKANPALGERIDESWLPQWMWDRATIHDTTATETRTAGGLRIIEEPLVSLDPADHLDPADGGSTPRCLP